MVRWRALQIAIVVLGCSRDPDPAAERHAAATASAPAPSAAVAASPAPNPSEGPSLPELGTAEQVAQDRAACDAGNHRRCAFLGWAYYTGKGAARDHKAAHELFKRACDNGVQAGCVPLGYMYQQGDVVPRDLERAIAIFKPACERGDLDVCIGLAELFERDKHDPSSASFWFRQACSGGKAEACAAERRLQAE